MQEKILAPLSGFRMRCSSLYQGRSEETPLWSQRGNPCSAGTACRMCRNMTENLFELDLAALDPKRVVEQMRSANLFLLPEDAEAMTKSVLSLLGQVLLRYMQDLHTINGYVETFWMRHFCKICEIRDFFMFAKKNLARAIKNRTVTPVEKYKASPHSSSSSAGSVSIRQQRRRGVMEIWAHVVRQRRSALDELSSAPLSMGISASLSDAECESDRRCFAWQFVVAHFVRLQRDAEGARILDRLCRKTQEMEVFQLLRSKLQNDHDAGRLACAVEHVFASQVPARAAVCQPLTDGFCVLCKAAASVQQRTETANEAQTLQNSSMSRLQLRQRLKEALGPDLINLTGSFTIFNNISNTVLNTVHPRLRFFSDSRTYWIRVFLCEGGACESVSNPDGRRLRSLSPAREAEVRRHLVLAVEDAVFSEYCVERERGPPRRYVSFNFSYTQLKQTVEKRLPADIVAELEADPCWQRVQQDTSSRVLSFRTQPVHPELFAFPTSSTEAGPPHYQQRVSMKTASRIAEGHLGGSDPLLLRAAVNERLARPLAGLLSSPPSLDGVSVVSRIREHFQQQAAQREPDSKRRNSTSNSSIREPDSKRRRQTERS